MKKKHQPFIRISWDEASEVLKSSLQTKYGAKGKLMFMHDYGYDGIGEQCDFPTYVDIYLKDV